MMHLKKILKYFLYAICIFLPGIIALPLFCLAENIDTMHYSDDDPDGKLPIRGISYC